MKLLSTLFAIAILLTTQNASAYHADYLSVPLESLSVEELKTTLNTGKNSKEQSAAIQKIIDSKLGEISPAAGASQETPKYDHYLGH